MTAPARARLVAVPRPVAPRTNLDLPASPSASSPALTPLIGRGRDLEQLRVRLTAGVRLITLTGAAGFGKSRLAHALGLDLVERGHSVWWVQVPRKKGEWQIDLGATVAAALGLPTGSADAFLQRLRGLGPFVMVLDDLEHAIAAAREVLPRWLLAAPELILICASREALDVPGEVRHAVGPLSIEDAEALFCARAESAGGSPDDEPRADVRELVRRLDGNPLAIELAASRAAILSPADLLSRLHHRFKWLARADAALWDALNASWEALSDAERAALMALSCFAAPATPNALEEVVAEPDALELIHGLQRKSLVHRVGARLSLYESIREFARAQLNLQPTVYHGLQGRMMAWADGLARRTLATFDERHADPETTRQLLDEQDNLIHLVEDADPTVASRILVALEPVFRRFGTPSRAAGLARSAGVELLDRLAPRLGQVPAALRARVHALHGILLVSARMDGARARAAFDAASAAAREAGDPILEGVVGHRAIALVHFGDLDRLAAHLEHAAALLDEHGSAPWDRAAARSACGTVHLHRGALDLARDALEDAVAQMRRGKMTALIGPALNNLGHLHGMKNAWREATAALREALDAAEADDNRMLTCVVRRNLGECALREGDDAGAEALFMASRELALALGDVRSQAVANGYLAGLALLRGEPERAATLARAARAHFAHAWNDPVAEGLLYGVLALAEAQLGELSLADATLATAASLLQKASDPALERVVALHGLHLAMLRADLSADAAIAQADALTRSTEGLRLHQVQHARRLLLAALGRTAPAAAPSRTLTIASDGTHFVSEDGVRTSLARRPSARKIMAQLAAAHRERRALDVETLFQAGWPGDKVREPYRSNRVYVLIAKLRSAGLGAALLHDGEGYRLDPDAAIVFT